MKMKFFLVALVVASACKKSRKDSESAYVPINNTEVTMSAENVDGEYRGRLQELIDLIDNHPKSAKLYAERAHLFVLMNKTMQAISDISMAVDLDPDNADYRTNKAQLLRQFQRNDEALKELNKALALNDRSVAAHFNRGALYFNMKKFDKALKDFTFCVEAMPDQPPPYFNRAFTYEMLHKIDLAKKDIKKFIAISTNDDWIKLAKDKLEEWNRVDYKTIIPNDSTHKLAH